MHRWNGQHDQDRERQEKVSVHDSDCDRPLDLGADAAGERRRAGTHAGAMLVIMTGRRRALSASTSASPGEPEFDAPSEVRKNNGALNHRHAEQADEADRRVDAESRPGEG